MRRHRCQCDTNWLCMDCGEDTDKMHEYYMVHDYLWNRAVPRQRQRRRQLCISCLERRLGRRLARRDFTRAPVNRLPIQSNRLRNRLGIRWRKAKNLESLYRRFVRYEALLAS